MSNFIDDVASRLVSSGIGTIGSSIFMGSKAAIPPGAGPFITLTETGGTGATFTQNQSAPASRRPTLQVVVRAGTYSAARAKAEAAWFALTGIWNTTVNGTFYQHITARQEPTDLGLDDVTRPMIGFNIDAERNAA